MYQVLIPKPVQKQLDGIPATARQRILTKIASLQENPRPSGCIKLKGYDREYRIRIGDYRVRYEIWDDRSIVLLLHCKDRKSIYRS